MSFLYQDKLIAQIVEGGRDMVVARYSAGKCRVALLAADQMTKSGDLVLVLSPKRNIHTWHQEIPKWWKSQVNAVYDSTPYDPLLLVHNRAADRKHLIVLSHRKVESALEVIKQLKPAVIILDESTAIKNPKSSLAESCHRLAAVMPLTRRLCLTGDPTPENQREIWSQMQFCYGKANPFGDTYYRFLNRWFLKAGFDWALRLEKTEEFNRVFDNASCRMDEDDVEEHRQVVGCREEYETVYYEASEEQLRLMKGLYLDWALPSPYGELGDDEIQEYWHTMAILQKAQQIAGGFYYTGKRGKLGTSFGGSGEVSTGRPVLLGTNPKLDALVRLVTGLLAQGEKRIVIWHAYQLDFGLIAERLADRCDFIMQESPSHLATFCSDNKSQMIAVLPVSAGKGINDLVVAAYDIYYSNVFSQETRNQCEGRLPRPGQRRSIVRHIDLACTALADSKVVMALQNKQLTDARLKTIVTELFPPVKGSPSTKSYRKRKDEVSK